MEHAKEICQEILDRKLNVTWRTNARVSPLDKELLQMMKASGCWWIGYGIEAGNAEMMKRIGKAITPELVSTAFKMTHELGIRTLAYFIIGLPGETEATIQDSLNLMRTLKSDFLMCSKPAIFPGTALYRQALSEGRCEPVRSGAFYNVTYYSTDELPEDRLDKYVRGVFKEKYYNPKYMIDRALKIRSLDELISTMQSTFSVMNSASESLFIGKRWLKFNAPALNNTDVPLD